MRQGLHSEELHFVESARRYLTTEWPFDQRSHATTLSDGFSRAQWAGFAELGWLGLPLPEEHGGLGLGERFVCLLMEELGASLVRSPYIPTVVVGAAAMEHTVDVDLRSALSAKIAAGELILAFANEEPGNLRNPLHVETRATASGRGYVINGRKSAVAFGGAADVLLVSTRIAGAPGERSGVALFLVDRASPGVTTLSFASFDDALHAEITLENVEVPANRAVGKVGDGAGLLELLIDRGAMALTAELTGAMRNVLNLTADYVKTRHQFDRPLGSNQALQHRLVDMFIACQEAESLVDLAVEAIATGDLGKARKAISAAKARVGRDALAVSKEGINIHGAIGLTKEYLAGHYLKRAVVLNQSYGDIYWHRERYAQLSGH